MTPIKQHKTVYESRLCGGWVNDNIYRLNNNQVDRMQGSLVGLVGLDRLARLGGSGHRSACVLHSLHELY